MTPGASVIRVDRTASVPGILHTLGVAGIELALDPVNADRLRHRPAVLLPEHADALKQYKPEVLALLRGEGVPNGDTEAAYVFEERLGVAQGLGMPVHPGSPAWLVAVGEAMGKGCLVATDWIH